VPAEYAGGGCQPARHDGPDGRTTVSAASVGVERLPYLSPQTVERGGVGACPVAVPTLTVC
jgi:hypothetical protein